MQGSKLTHKLKEQDGVKALHSGRTLEEARKLVEQSFGNYVGSNVMLAAKEELTKIKYEIEFLSSEITDDSIDRKCQEQLSQQEYSEISVLQDEIRVTFSISTLLRYIFYIHFATLYFKWSILSINWLFIFLYKMVMHMYCC